MKGHGAKLPRLQEEAIEALLSLGNRNLAEVAAAIGISTKTLRRWMLLPDFNEAYLRARRQVVSQSHGRLQQGTSMASLLLLKIMSDPSVKPAHRLQAAKIVMELAGKSLEDDDILVRLDRLEKQRANGSDGRATKTEYRWEDTPDSLALTPAKIEPEDEEPGT
jgi:hypothetical protein